MLAIGTRRAPHEAGVLQASDHPGHRGRVGVHEADEVGLALETQFPQAHHHRLLTKVKTDAAQQIALPILGITSVEGRLQTASVPEQAVA
jgi:hypothetical protein